jgi:histidyl-tRNA synthetase
MVGDFGNSIKALNDAGLPFEISFAMPLNFEYYTGLVMEVYPGREKTKRGNLLITGGRYDNLVELMSGKEVSATASGFVLKVENVIDAPEFVKALSERAVMVRPGGDIGYARALVSGLRDFGFIAEIAGVGQNKANFRWIVGFDEKGVSVTDTEGGDVEKIERERIKDGKELAGFISSK